MIINFQPEIQSVHELLYLLNIDIGDRNKIQNQPTNKMVFKEDKQSDGLNYGCRITHTFMLSRAILSIQNTKNGKLVINRSEELTEENIASITS